MVLRPEIAYWAARCKCDVRTVNFHHVVQCEVDAMKSWLVVGLVSGISLVSGCGESSSNKGGAVELVAPAASNENDAAKKVASANKAYLPPVQQTLPDPEFPLAMINDGAGVINSDFSDSVDQVPNYWNVGGGVRILNGGFDNSPAAACDKRGGRLSQDLLFNESPAGKTITFTAQAMSVVPGLASIEIQLENGARQASEKHPGDKQWHKLSTSIKVPEDYESDSATIWLISRRSEADMVGTVYAAWFDEANVTIE